MLPGQAPQIISQHEVEARSSSNSGVTVQQPPFLDDNHGCMGSHGLLKKKKKCCDHKPRNHLEQGTILLRKP